MVYDSCYDYYFWQGVEIGLNNRLTYDNENEGLVLPEFWIDNPTNLACQDAFAWGYYLGLELTFDEYLELTIEAEKPKEILESAEEKDEFEYKYEQPMGNC